MNSFDYWFDYIMRNGEYNPDSNQPFFGGVWEIKTKGFVYDAYFLRWTRNDIKKMISVDSPMIEGSGMMATVLCDEDNFEPGDFLMKNLTSPFRMV